MTQKWGKTKLSLRRTGLFEVAAHCDGDAWTSLGYAGDPG